MYDGVVRVEIDTGMGLLCTVCAPMECNFNCPPVQTSPIETGQNVACSPGSTLVGRTQMYVLSSWPLHHIDLSRTRACSMKRDDANMVAKH